MALIKLHDHKTITENLVIPRGVDYQQLFTVTDRFTKRAIDFSGFSSSVITSKIKQYPESVSFAATFTSSLSNSSSGVIKLTLSDTETSKLSPGKYYYDIVMIVESKTSADTDSDTYIARLAEGTIIVE
jgi:hypothetical protein